jgi:hypothetical protein
VVDRRGLTLGLRGSVRIFVPHGRDRQLDARGAHARDDAVHERRVVHLARGLEVGDEQDAALKRPAALVAHEEVGSHGEGVEEIRGAPSPARSGRFDTADAVSVDAHAIGTSTETLRYSSS